MKKVYTTPVIKMAHLALQAIVCGSMGVNSDKGIDYGGLDEEGKKEPAIRRKRNIWTDEEEDTNEEFLEI